RSGSKSSWSSNVFHEPGGTSPPGSPPSFLNNPHVLPLRPSSKVLDGLNGVIALASPSAPKMDEAALIRAAQNGDAVAFEQLVRAYDQSVLRLALNLLRSPEDASDIYQEAFL